MQNKENLRFWFKNWEIYIPNRIIYVGWLYMHYGSINIGENNPYDFLLQFEFVWSGPDHNNLLHRLIICNSPARFSHHISKLNIVLSKWTNLSSKIAVKCENSYESTRQLCFAVWVRWHWWVPGLVTQRIGKYKNIFCDFSSQIFSRCSHLEIQTFDDQKID